MDTDRIVTCLSASLFDMSSLSVKSCETTAVGIMDCK